MVVWFQDHPGLAHMAFSPAWITDGVYSVLYSKDAYDKEGRLSEAEFHAVLEAAKKGYSVEDKKLIIEAMRAFKTAFEKKGVGSSPRSCRWRRRGMSSTRISRSLWRLRFESSCRRSCCRN